MKSVRRDALDRLIPLLYDELRAIARRWLHEPRGSNTLATDDLVHEVYVRLANPVGFERLRPRPPSSPWRLSP